MDELYCKTEMDLESWRIIYPGDAQDTETIGTELGLYDRRSIIKFWG